MLASTENGFEISIISGKNGVLHDTAGRDWTRDAEKDRDEKAAFSSADMTIGLLLLDKCQLVRVCKGDRAIQQVTTVAEVRDFASRLDNPTRDVIDGWSDQRIREIMAECEDNGGAVINSVLAAANKELEELWKTEREAQEGPEETHETGEGTGVPSPSPEAKKRPRKAKKSRSRDHAFMTEVDGQKINLTTKQVEFLERLSENPTWKIFGVKGIYHSDSYADELSDTMTPMAVGAMITTLREKGLLETNMVRSDGKKVCAFKLTVAGAQVYNDLCRRGGI